LVGDVESRVAKEAVPVSSTASSNSNREKKKERQIERARCGLKRDVNGALFVPLAVLRTVGRVNDE
jgi:hypothetical protein